MNEEKKQQLAFKKLTLAFRLEAKTFVERKIRYHWLPVYTKIKEAGMNNRLISLVNTTPEMAPFFQDAIQSMAYPEFTTRLICTTETSLMDTVFERFPSTELLKYTMGIPRLPIQSDDVSLIFEAANQLIDFGREPVFFLSPDWSPVLALNWEEIISKGATIFDDVSVAFLFVNAGLIKILFKSIEDEWQFLRDD